MSADRSPVRAGSGAGLPTTTLPIIVDRVACTGRGICASILTEQVGLDEWGYPIVHRRQVDPELAEIAVRLCPARALSLGVPS